MTSPAILRISALLGLALGLGSCVLSVDPVVAESDASFDARLLGVWEQVGGSDRAVFTRATGNNYAIEYTSDDEVSSHEARLGPLGEHLVLDAWTVPKNGEIADPQPGQLLGAHMLLVLVIGADQVKVNALDHDAMLAALQSGKLALAHREAEYHLTLQGSTERLRSALGPYLASAGALSEPSVWRRAADAAAVPRLPVEPQCFEASAWHEADALFHRDGHWVGGDGASTVDLGRGRTLWLFGDSWIDPDGRATRDGARLVSNSVAIQTGADPTKATIKFYWGRSDDGSPAAFVPDQGDERHWFGNGVRLGKRLLLFLNRVRSSSGGLGFDSGGWTAWMVDNPDSEPSAWAMRELKTAENPLGIPVGFAAVLQQDGYVYAFGSQEPVKSHPIYAARWTTRQIRNGKLLSPEWWGGDRSGWVANSSSAPRWPIFENGQAEGSIHWDQASQGFIAVHSQGFGAADIVLRAAPHLTGPWSAPRMIYRPSEYYRPQRMIYAAKAHPELSGADLVLTYNSNSFDFSEQVSDHSIYYPRFVRLATCR
ncbi:MAG: DUF4185 domain-containing protein [Porticoccaceae bacterium]